MSAHDTFHASRLRAHLSQPELLKRTMEKRSSLWWHLFGGVTQTFLRIANGAGKAGRADGVAPRIASSEALKCGVLHFILGRRTTRYEGD